MITYAIWRQKTLQDGRIFREGSRPGVIKYRSTRNLRSVVKKYRTFRLPRRIVFGETIRRTLPKLLFPCRTYRLCVIVITQFVPRIHPGHILRPCRTAKEARGGIPRTRARTACQHRQGLTAARLTALLGGERAKIVANLPYNIATVLLIDWLCAEPWPPWYDMMVLMFQREVAERIVAQPDSEAYGRLAVLANWRAETKILFDISPAAFVPQPKVTSSVVRLVPRSSPEPCDRRALEQVAAAAFGQRRKMLRQSLKSLSVDPARLAEAAHVEPTRRAETIPVSGFVAMARELADIRNTKPNTV